MQLAELLKTINREGVRVELTVSAVWPMPRIKVGKRTIMDALRMAKKAHGEQIEIAATVHPIDPDNDLVIIG